MSPLTPDERGVLNETIRDCAEVVSGGTPIDDKAHPRFMAGYDAGLKDGKRMRRFPVELRKQWGGYEVQAWIDDNIGKPPAEPRAYYTIAELNELMDKHLQRKADEIAASIQRKALDRLQPMHEVGSFRDEHKFGMGPNGYQCQKCGKIWSEVNGKPANGECLTRSKS